MEGARAFLERAIELLTSGVSHVLPISGTDSHVDAAAVTAQLCHGSFYRAVLTWLHWSWWLWLLSLSLWRSLVTALLNFFWVM